MSDCTCSIFGREKVRLIGERVLAMIEAEIEAKDPNSPSNIALAEHNLRMAAGCLEMSQDASAMTAEVIGYMAEPRHI